jgi:nucleoside permease NupC
VVSWLGVAVVLVAFTALVDWVESVLSVLIRFRRELSLLTLFEILSTITVCLSFALGEKCYYAHSH